MESGNYYEPKISNLVKLATMSSFLGGYQLGVLGPCQDNVAYTLGWSGSYKLLMLTVCFTVFPIGGFFGSMYSGKLADKVGRRQAMTITCYIMIFSAGLNALPYTPSFIIARFIAGIVTGVGTTVPMIYIKEIVPKIIFSKNGSLIQLQMCFGIFLANLLGIALPPTDFSSPMNDWWIFMFLFPILVSLAQLVLMHCFLKLDTPQWLMERGRLDSVYKSLKEIYDEPSSVSILNAYFDEHLDTQSKIQSADDLELEGKQAAKPPGLMSSTHRKGVLIGCTLAILQQLSGINVISMFSNNIMVEAGGEADSHYFTAVISFVNFAAAYLAVYIVPRFGRRRLLLIGAAGMFACNILIGFCSFLNLEIFLSIGFICLFLIFFQCSIGTVLWVYLSEVMVDRGIKVAVAFNRAFVGVVGASTLYLASPSALGITGLFFLYGGFCGFMLIFIIAYCRETKITTISPTKI